MLKQWIDKARSTKIKELMSFTNGIERDYDAVMNDAHLPYSNGLAEGGVNKIKVLKESCMAGVVLKHSILYDMVILS